MAVTQSVNSPGTKPARTVASPATVKKEAEAKAELEAKIKRQEEGVAGIFQTGAAIALMIGWTADAGALYMHAEPISKGAVAYAQTDERISNGLDYIARVAPIMALAEPVGKLVAQLLANHNIVSPDKLASLGVVRPESIVNDTRAMIIDNHIRSEQNIAAAEQRYAEFMQAKTRAAQQEATFQPGPVE